MADDMDDESGAAAASRQDRVPLNVHGSGGRASTAAAIRSGYGVSDSGRGGGADSNLDIQSDTRGHAHGHSVDRKWQVHLLSCSKGMEDSMCVACVWANSMDKSGNMAYWKAVSLMWALPMLVQIIILVVMRTVITDKMTNGDVSQGWMIIYSFVALSWFVIFLICVPVRCMYRRKIRDQRRIPGSKFYDCLAHLCCYPCAARQEAVEVIEIGRDRHNMQFGGDADVPGDGMHRV